MLRRAFRPEDGNVVANAFFAILGAEGMGKLRKPLAEPGIEALEGDAAPGQLPLLLSPYMPPAEASDLSQIDPWRQKVATTETVWPNPFQIILPLMARFNSIPFEAPSNPSIT